MKNTSCPACGSQMVSEERDDVVTHGSQQRTVRVKGDWCNRCGEAVFNGAALKIREDALLQMKNTMYITTITALTNKLRVVTAVGRHSGRDLTPEGVLDVLVRDFFGSEEVKVDERYVSVSFIVTDYESMKIVASKDYTKSSPGGPWKLITDMERHNAAMEAQWNIMSSGDDEEDGYVKKSAGVWIIFGVVGVAMILFAYMLQQGLKGIMP